MSTNKIDIMREMKAAFHDLFGGSPKHDAVPELFEAGWRAAQAERNSSTSQGSEGDTTSDEHEWDDEDEFRSKVLSHAYEADEVNYQIEPVPVPNGILVTLYTGDVMRVTVTPEVAIDI